MGRTSRTGRVQQFIDRISLTVLDKDGASPNQRKFELRERNTTKKMRNEKVTFPSLISLNNE